MQVVVECQGYEPTDSQILLIKDRFLISHINEVDEYTPSIVVNGNLFVQGLQCELSLEGVVTLTDAIYQS